MTIAARPRAGMTLIELMGALALISAFTLMAGQLLVTTLRVTAAAGDVPRPDRAGEALIEKMRADVWGAAEVVITREQTLILRFTGERSIFWTLAPDEGKVHRRMLVGTQVQNEQVFDSTDPPQRFTRYGPGVQIHWGLDDSSDGRAVNLYSGLILLGGGGP